MFFLYRYHKNRNFFSFTAWFLLYGFGILLTSTLETQTYLIKQAYVSNIITTNVLDQKNKSNDVNITTSINKNFLTLYIGCASVINIFKNTLNLSLITAVTLSEQLRNYQAPYFTSKRAPPIA